MIDCTAQNIWYKKKRRKFKKTFALFLVVLIIVCTFFYYKSVILKQIYKICADYSYAYCTESTNYAVTKSLSENLAYSELVNIEKNSNGDVILMSANAQKVNTINRNVERLTAEFLKAKLKSGIKIPFWAFSGVSILSGYGKEIEFYALSVSSVACQFSSKFESAGINQTLHTIYVDVVCTVKIEVPFSNSENKYTNSVLISETILIGKVPEIYLGGKLFS